MRTWPYVLIMDTTYKINKVWTSKVLHFGIETTNRIKSEHSVLKLWHSTCHGNLDTVFLNIDSVIEGQIAEIKSSFEYSMLKEKYNAKSNPILKNISNNISHLALKKIWVEIKRAPEIIDDPINKCRHYLRISHGLLCLCELITWVHDCIAFVLANGSYWRYDSYRSPGRTPAFYCCMPNINLTSCNVIVIFSRACGSCLCLAATSQQKQIIALYWGAGTCKTSNGQVCPFGQLCHLR
ncbi:hypothetical protein M9H77_23270 [Catharanthus roseus]|uniref:Uncharacterized protein n=1 Tax=Catharanthus roseus TaxID=4058 RepID=A0ACC0AVC7_CATRO|nr:hypothetical protein M9H77_23270 [Catharanthus roseus]